jgi:hypothetical protein
MNAWATKKGHNLRSHETTPLTAYNSDAHTVPKHTVCFLRHPHRGTQPALLSTRRRDRQRPPRETGKKCLKNAAKRRVGSVGASSGSRIEIVKIGKNAQDGARLSRDEQFFLGSATRASTNQGARRFDRRLTAGCGEHGQQRIARERIVSTRLATRMLPHTRLTCLAQLASGAHF